MSAVAPARPTSRAAAPARTPAPRRTHAPGHAPGSRSPARPALRLVAVPRAAAARLPFALLVAAILGSGLVALLMLHTLAAQDGFTLHKLQRQSAGLADLEQQLTVANQQAQAPSTLAARARAIGMVPTGDLHVVRRRDGRVVAVASAVVVARPAPAPSPSAASSPTPNPSSQPSTRSTSPSTSQSTSTSQSGGGRHGKPRAPH